MVSLLIRSALSQVNPGDKKLEFVFHAPDRTGALSPSGAKALDVEPDVWRDFKQIHFAQAGRKENPNWTFWRGEFVCGEPVPVFYLKEGGKITTMGTAFMFKTAMPLSTHDMLTNSHGGHLRNGADSTKRDLPGLIFGDVANDFGEQGLKRRASFDLARVYGQPNAELGDKIERAILLEPKPSYYPAYVRQPGDPATGRLGADTYAIYQEDATAAELERKRPRLAGVKMWPARGRFVDYVCPAHLANEPSIQTTLCPLREGTRFRTVLRFHNLRPIELGAVLWALSLGENAGWTPGAPVRLRHRMGMGKPYGLGEVVIRILPGTFCADANDGSAPPGISALVNAFTDHMRTVAPGWRNLPQLRTLLAAADPNVAELQQEGSFDYMTLDPTARPRRNDFSAAKQAGRFLPDYMVDPMVPAPYVGARVLIAGIHTGTIKELPTDPKHPQFLVLVDRQTIPRRYPARLVQIIE